MIHSLQSVDKGQQESRDVTKIGLRLEKLGLGKRVRFLRF